MIFGEFNVEYSTMGDEIKRNRLRELTLEDNSLMKKWLNELPDEQEIVQVTYNGDINIIAWGIIVVPGYLREEKIEEGTIGIFVHSDYREKGLAFEIGKLLLTKAKSDNIIKRIECSYRTEASKKLYKNLAKFIGAKRHPFTPKSLWEFKQWKIIYLS